MATVTRRYYITTPAIYAANMYLFIPGFSQTLVLNGTYSLIICDNFTVIANQIAWEATSGVGALQDPSLQAAVTFTALIGLAGSTFTAPMLAAITAKFPGVVGTSTVWDLSAACSAGGYEAMVLNGTAAGSATSTSFNNLTSGVNDSGQSLVVGSTSTLTATGTGVIEATELATTGAAVVINTAAPPTTGQVLTATGATTANWQTGGGGGGSEYTVTSQTTTYTAASYDDVWCNGTFTVTSPSPTTGNRFKVSNQGTGAITVSPVSGLIMGNASMILDGQYNTVELSSDGTNWTVE